MVKLLCGQIMVVTFFFKKKMKIYFMKRVHTLLGLGDVKLEYKDKIKIRTNSKENFMVKMIIWSNHNNQFIVVKVSRSRII